MRKHASRLVAVILILVLLGMAFLLVEKSVGNQQSALRDKYDSIQVGMSLSQAEAILGTPKGYYAIHDTTTLIVAHTTSRGQESHPGVNNYYPGKRCGVILWYNPHTQQVTSKEFWLYRYATHPAKVIRFAVDSAEDLF
jgi:hypothetical protein